MIYNSNDNSNDGNDNTYIRRKLSRCERSIKYLTITTKTHEWRNNECIILGAIDFITDAISFPALSSFRKNILNILCDFQNSYSMTHYSTN